MNTKQIIQNMEKEFDRQFVKYNGRYIEDSFIDPNGLVGPVRKFIKEYTRSLLSAFAEEVIGENEEKDFPDYILPRNDLRQDQRLKVKEIISEIGKWKELLESLQASS